MWSAVLAVWISGISIQSYEIWSLTNGSLPSETNVRQPPNYPKVSYDSSEFDPDAYREMIRRLRQLLVSGNFNNGIPVMRPEDGVTNANRYVLVEITETRRQTVAFAINVVDAYVIGYRIGNRSYFFTEAPENAPNYLFTGATEIPPRQSSNYNHLQNRPNTPARRDITLGLRTLDAAVTTLLSDPQNGRSLIIIIQMISEAARFWDIESRVLRNDAFLPDDYMLDLTNNWGALSEQIQSSIATAFQRVVSINNQRVDNVNHFVIAGLFLMKFMCDNNRRPTTTSVVSHLQPTNLEDDTCRVSVEPRMYIRGRNGLCADVEGYVYRDGTPIVLFTCRTADAGNELWTLRENGRIESLSKCLTASGSTAGSSVIIHDCDTAHSSLIHWEMSNNGTLTNRVSKLVLTANGGTTGSPLTVENNNFGSFQAWTPTTSITDPAVSIHWNNNLCIYYNGHYGAYTEACLKGSARQEWRLYPDSTIRPANWIDGCLELASETGIASGFVYIQVGKCDEHPELHRWIFNHRGNIQNLKTNAVVQVWPTNHAYIHAAYPSNSINQIWTLQSA